MSDRPETNATGEKEKQSEGSEGENEVREGGGEAEGESRTQTPTAAIAEGEEASDEIERLHLVTVEDGCVNIRIPFFLCLMGAVIVVLLGVSVTFLVMIVRGPQLDVARQVQEVGHRVGQDAVHVFRGHDLNRDHHLSLSEFKDLVPHIRNVESLASKVKLAETYPKYTPKKGEEVMVVHANFSRLHLKPLLTLSDFLSLSLKELGSKMLELYLRVTRFYLIAPLTGQRTLYGLDTWTEPNRKHEVFGAAEFQSLLPDDADDLEVGLPYRLLHYSAATSGDYLSDPYTKQNSRKYVPSVPQGARERLLFRLLAMMHPRPFVQMRFHPRGTVACVQALNDEYVHIVFRMHAEFQLSEVPANPFWFTPAQFLGDLVISRDGSHVHYFHMHVPTDRKLNVDMEWMLDAVEGYEGMEVDIGYLPLMEWTMGGDSHLPLPGQSIRPDMSLTPAPSNMVWNQETAREDVLRLMEADFYEFKRVTYHNLTQAVRLSREVKRPLHAIFLWGALDDQSC